MILPSPKDAVHKGWLYRVLIAICDDTILPSVLCFKGGTCAAMLGWLDRFSIDLDFDYTGPHDAVVRYRNRLQDVLLSLGLTIDDQSSRGLQFFLRYPVAPGERNTLKIDTGFPPLASNIYEPLRLPDIDRVIICQTLETAFANKLVACMERYAKRESIAGRDIYDIHHFFFRGFRYHAPVIKERTGIALQDFFAQLIEFVDRRVTKTTIDEDINPLLVPSKFRAIRKSLKQETLMFLRDELKRLTSSSRA